ncbi:MAG: mercury methylation corrinoid protein HgcA [Desulfobacterales bacterium]
MDNNCCGINNNREPFGKVSHLKPFAMTPLKQNKKEEACCGPPPGPECSRFARPGYEICGFVEDFIETAAGPVPKIITKLSIVDHAMSVLARFGIGRDSYGIAPGIYCAGTPDADSQVLVTANYKLTFDALRKELSSVDAWILVLDTRGINVWCAAGKSLFSTEEVIKRVKVSGLDKIVSHRELILPQLSATGVSAIDVKKGSGFKVIWGPIRANDIKQFLDAGKKADESMRRVTFTISERLVLVPVELSFLVKPTVFILLGFFLLSGIGTNIFSIKDAWGRGLMAVYAYAAGIFAGAVLVPAILPWIPGKAFSIKGALTGIISAFFVVMTFKDVANSYELTALSLCTAAVSSYLGMNFTGSTPYTSPSGVEKEMRKAMPVQALAGLASIVLWISAAFVR